MSEPTQEVTEVMISANEIMEILTMEMQLNCPQRDYFNMTSKDVYAAGATDSAEIVRFNILMEIKRRYFPAEYEAAIKELRAIEDAKVAALEEEAKKAKEVALPTPPEGSLQ